LVPYWRTFEDATLAVAHVPRGIEDDARYALYANAHHDLWWARTQQWSVANWTVLLIAGIAGVGRTLTPWTSLTLYHTWPYVGMVGLVGGFAAVLFGKLHDEIVHNREVYRTLENQTGIEELRKKLPGPALGKEKPDWYRGIGPVTLMVVLTVAVAGGFAALLLGVRLDLAVVLAIVILTFDVVWILYAAWKWKPRQQVCKRCSHRRFMHEQSTCFGDKCSCTGFS